eukprot:CAMPEP_0113278016 /NCGR_PEP_ID=MMETSP0008_2-20120614/26366_1 /TAXON_ID=97485 /ORGANISM="Prymnesium parvum" /LENGTH=49 /DNA_ID=CAMNT_0000127985 /DNA_START=160 /DNA_END=309 /DNA_ORIENTATION=+ /assembly_acc=CAM_ASM_000153
MRARSAAGSKQAGPLVGRGPKWTDGVGRSTPTEGGAGDRGEDAGAELAA